MTPIRKLTPREQETWDRVMFADINKLERIGKTVLAYAQKLQITPAHQIPPEDGCTSSGA
jgi:hypothetical protein